MEILILFPVFILLAAVTKKISKATGVHSAYVFITLFIWAIGLVISLSGSPSVMFLFLPFVLIAIWNLFIASMKWAFRILNDED